jgi:hypothetical protein
MLPIQIRITNELAIAQSQYALETQRDNDELRDMLRDFGEALTQHSQGKDPETHGPVSEDADEIQAVNALTYEEIGQ